MNHLTSLVSRSPFSFNHALKQHPIQSFSSSTIKTQKIGKNSLSFCSEKCSKKTFNSENFVLTPQSTKPIKLSSSKCPFILFSKKHEEKLTQAIKQNKIEFIENVFKYLDEQSCIDLLKKAANNNKQEIIQSFINKGVFSFSFVLQFLKENNKEDLIKYLSPNFKNCQLKSTTQLKDFLTKEDIYSSLKNEMTPKRMDESTGIVTDFEPNLNLIDELLKDKRLTSDEITRLLTISFLPFPCLLRLLNDSRISSEGINQFLSKLPEHCLTNKGWKALPIDRDYEFLTLHKQSNETTVLLILLYAARNGSTDIIERQVKDFRVTASGIERVLADIEENESNHMYFEPEVVELLQASLKAKI